VPLGTVEVRQYLGERPEPERPAALDAGSMAQTSGPANRYGTVLFIEKEGFDALLDRALIAERFDCAIMSTKGMSVTAARMLIDGIVQHVDRVLVLHDFDVSGFSIFGTLGTSNRRYRFDNPVTVIDLGLRLADIAAMGLRPEDYTPGGDWSKRAETLEAHGASRREIAFLHKQRVELNAMPSDVFIAFIEAKLAEHGVRKLVPEDDVLQQHARGVITRALLNQRLDAIRAAVEAEADAVALPEDLRTQVERQLQHTPEIPWDLAVAAIARSVVGTDNDGDEAEGGAA
jgi:hypothetical protein